MLALALVLGALASPQTLRADEAVHPAPTRAQVKRVCENYDLKLYKWNFIYPYLICYSIDQYTDGADLYVQGTSGRFTLRKGTGGAFDARYLETLGVPADIAPALVAGLHR